MKTLLVVVALLTTGVLVAACGEVNADLCDDLVEAAIACEFSGIDEHSGQAIYDDCLQDNVGVDCALDAYQNHCTSAMELAAAFGPCYQ
jgi:hypothetical protein